MTRAPWFVQDVSSGDSRFMPDDRPDLRGLANPRSGRGRQGVRSMQPTRMLERVGPRDERLRLCDR